MYVCRYIFITERINFRRLLRFLITIDKISHQHRGQLDSLLPSKTRLTRTVIRASKC